MELLPSSSSDPEIPPKFINICTVTAVELATFPVKTSYQMRLPNNDLIANTG